LQPRRHRAGAPHRLRPGQQL
ncbi:transposase, partial [Escherichia coli]|nr:transposase [Salmonella enterica]EFN5461892.1 transposase [Escherichia coli]MGS80537.1 transposase [Escherichia coli]